MKILCRGSRGVLTTVFLTRYGTVSWIAAKGKMEKERGTVKVKFVIFKLGQSFGEHVSVGAGKRPSA